MNHDTRYLELRYGACSWSEVCGITQMAGWLRKAGKLRADKQIEPDLMIEVLSATAGQLTCPQCERLGLTAAAPPDDADDWPEARACEACSRPIDPQRLEAVADATLCAACQRKDELGQLETETEYCPKCGSVMQLQPGKSRGITRYVYVCTGNPPCRL
ncbi:MAG: TraR/DksA C4-type zinc finger protein [Candidatus Nealsonbacteria bacterium]|nr:TraR/DksA C4-type zinc finger protein [Candidatus Nealsonbacteria bacterium]